MVMQVRPIGLVATLLFALCSLAVNNDTRAQTAAGQLALRSGESIDLYPVYYVANCRSIMIGLPEIEVLEGPPELTLSIREEPVLPRRQGCAGKVPGGTLMLNAKKITEPFGAKLTIRVNYKTKDGPRQTSNSYIVSLFP
jgi:hypothetical protein